MLKRFGIMAVIAALSWGSGASANDVYIEQIGDGATVTILQDGNSNRIGADGTPSVFKGDANIVTIDQIGSSNTLDAIINGAAVTVVVTTNGSSNTQVINCGTANSATCGSSYIKQEVSGDNNTDWWCGIEWQHHQFDTRRNQCTTSNYYFNWQQ